VARLRLAHHLAPSALLSTTNFFASKKSYLMALFTQAAKLSHASKVKNINGAQI
jgi:hypothetical protein